MLNRLLNLSENGYTNLKKAITACVISNLLMLPPFIILMKCMETLIHPITAGESLNTGRLWLLFGLGLLSAAVYFIAHGKEYDRTYTTAYSEAQAIRLEVAEHMRRLPLSYFNRKDLSELTTNIMADCSSIEHIMSHVVPQLVANIITVILTSILLALYDWRMSLAMFCVLPIAFGILFFSKRLQARFGERHVEAKLDVSTQIQEYLDGIKVVKAFGLAGEKSVRLERSLKCMMNEAIRFEMIAGSFVALAVMFLQVGIGLVVLVGVNLLTSGTLDTVAFLTFVLISAKIYAPIITITTLLPEFFYMLISTRRMQALRKESLMEGNEQEDLSSFDVEFKKVTFAYGEEAVIKDMSFTIPQGSITALVGPSGSGKSTVSRLIARFWDVSKGEIIIGGKNIREIEPERLMSYMSFVFQDVVLFNDTVINNIRIGRQDASEEEVHQAAKLAHCDEFIRMMPKGYDTIIGENGCTLSGGERQRLSIARALLKNAPIVLLDEATASVDPENETKIQSAISELVKGRTVIVIAHRLRTVKDADQIIVLENGRITEVGAGDQLIAQKGLFAKLYQIQQESLGWSV